MVLTLFMMRILTSGYISMSRFARIWAAPWMSATPAWMRIISSWASAAAPAVPDPDLAPVQVALLRVRAALQVQAALPRDRAALPVQVARLLRGWAALPVQAVLLRVERLMVTATRRYPVWW